MIYHETLQVHSLALEMLGNGQSLEWPGHAPGSCMTPAPGEGPAQQKEQAGFTFTNMLPPVPAGTDTEQDDWISERSLLEGSSAASSPKPEQAVDGSSQPDRHTDASGSEPHASTALEQPVSDGAAALAEASVQHDLDFDIDCLLLSSISLCSPRSCQPPSLLESTHVLEPPASSGQQQPVSGKEAALAKVPGHMPAQPEQSSASALFVNVLPQPDGEPSAPSSSHYPLPADGVSKQQPPNDIPHELALFSNVLPSPDQQPSMHSSSSESVPWGGDVDKQQASAQVAAGTGLSRREEFRQKLAVAQAAQLGATGQAAPASSSPEATGIGTEHQQSGSRSTEEHHSNSSVSPRQDAPLHTAELEITNTQDEESSIASSEPEQAPLGIEGHADKAADGSCAGMQWADNAAAGESNGEHEDPSDLAIRRMSAVARQSAQAPAPQLSTTSTDAAAPHSIEALHGAHEEDDDAEKAHGSLSSSGSKSAPGVATTPIGTAVHWAQNAASTGAAHSDLEEPDEALLHAMRRMSVVAREQGLSHSPISGSSLSTTEPEHTGNTLPSKVQQSTQQDPRADSPILPSLHPVAEKVVSLVSRSEPGSGQTGQGSLPTSLMGSTSATGPLHGAETGQAPSSPGRASYEQLLLRFKGSPAPERCFTPPPCSPAQIAEQDTGRRHLPHTLKMSRSDTAVPFRVKWL